MIRAGPLNRRKWQRTSDSKDMPAPIQDESTIVQASFVDEDLEIMKGYGREVDCNGFREGIFRMGRLYDG